jgi:hypothetical protein
MTNELPSGPSAPLEVHRCARFAVAPQQEPVPSAIRIDHDGFEGIIIGRYKTNEGKRGVVLQQVGTKVVHVYGERWIPEECREQEPDPQWRREVPDTDGYWWDMESAPLETSVLVAVGQCVGEAKQHEDAGWYWAGNNPTDAWGGQINPDHWQPLPQPPGGES